VAAIYGINWKSWNIFPVNIFQRNFFPRFFLYFQDFPVLPITSVIYIFSHIWKKLPTRRTKGCNRADQKILQIWKFLEVIEISGNGNIWKWKNLEIVESGNGKYFHGKIWK